jgi:hypothetical protein
VSAVSARTGCGMAQASASAVRQLNTDKLSLFIMI